MSETTYVCLMCGLPGKHSDDPDKQIPAERMYDKKPCQHKIFTPAPPYYGDKFW
jgi:DNA-directed RNA polymerase subunit RPC12/RpoP